MATLDSVMAKLQSLIAKMNGKTGRSDANIADAVDALISGYNPSGTTPSGTKTITENGTHDVAGYASAFVNVPVPAEKMVVLPITISADLGAGTNSNPVIVTGNSFVKQHYADDGFLGILIPLSAESITAGSGVVPFVYQSNRPLIKTSTTYYSVFVKSNGASSSAAGQANAYKFNAKGYNVSLRADSSGNVNLYVGSSFTVKAGNYLLVLALAE